MATKEELFAAVRLIKRHCTEIGMDCLKKSCPLADWCENNYLWDCENPKEWRDPEEAAHEFD